MASLRRPSLAIPKNEAPPVQSTARPPLPGDAIQKRDARKSKVGDKIKKRISMRYAGTEDYSSQGSVPPLPGQSGFLDSDPYQGITTRNDEGEDDIAGSSRFGQFASSEFQSRGFTDRGEEGIKRRGAADMTREEEWDSEESGKDGFDVQAFLKRTMTGADAAEIKRFNAASQRAKQTNAKESQRNVFKHYAEFVNMSKEIATSENDMSELKDSSNQWRDSPQLMGMESTSAPTLDKHGNLERRRTQRNSIADLAQMYKAQLSNLWSTVEGSQKYVPSAPGRHLVFETHAFVELNAATYKAKQNVSMFSSNDSSLIAGRRRMKAGPPGSNGANERNRERDRGRMVAERCWVSAESVVVDVKDSGDSTNALKIKRGKEVCVYRTARPEDKKALSAAFRQVSQELGEKKRKESEKEQQRRKSMWQGENGTSSASISPGRPASSLGMTMSDSKDLRWIEDFGDELTMAIAMRDWDAAVSLVEKSRELDKIAAPNPAAAELIASRLTHSRPKLVSQILHDLSSHNSRKATAARSISSSSRLDSANLARDTFLNARREVMLERVRGIKCDGDTTIYISESAIVCFTIIRHTSDWYMTAFKENAMASGFISWAKDQIETFGDLFRRQVYVSTISQSVAEECMRIVASHNRKSLRDVGLDFTFLLSSLLSPDPESQQNAPVIHPIFDISAPTPSPAYHINPSPYPPFNDTPSPPDHAQDADNTIGTPGKTAPSAINPRSPRRPRPSVKSEASATPGSPPVPLRSPRRSGSSRQDLVGSPEGREESLR